MKPLYVTALVLTVIGALNWGLIGFFDFDLVAAIFGGQGELGARIVYALVGVAGLVVLVMSPALGGAIPARTGEERERQAVR